MSGLNIITALKKYSPTVQRYADFRKKHTLEIFKKYIKLLNKRFLKNQRSLEWKKDQQHLREGW